MDREREADMGSAISGVPDTDAGSTFAPSPRAAVARRVGDVALMRRIRGRAVQRQARGGAAPRQGAGSEVIRTRYGAFEVYPDRESIPRADARSTWVTTPIARADFAGMMAAMTAVENDAARHFAIEGAENFRSSVLGDLARIASIARGAELLRALRETPHTIRIVMAEGGDTSITGPQGTDIHPHRDSRGREQPGRGASCTIAYKWNQTAIFPDIQGAAREAWMDRPTFIGLVHELIHAYQITHGIVPSASTERRGGIERIGSHQTGPAEDSVVGLGAAARARYTENGFRAAFGLPLRTVTFPSPPPATEAPAPAGP